MTDTAATAAAPATNATAADAGAQGNAVTLEVKPAAATPATTASEPAKAEEGDKGKEGTEAVQYEPTGNQGLDMALNFIAARGLDAEHPAVKAAMEGNFDFLRATLAGMGKDAVGYEAYVALAEKAYAEMSAADAEGQKAREQAAISVVGDPAEVVKVLDWARENADPKEAEDINAMFAASPLQAKAAMMYLHQLYQNAGNTVPAAAPVNKDAGNPATPATGPLTARDYAAAVEALHRKMGSRMEGSPEYEALNQRRRLGRQRGL